MKARGVRIGKVLLERFEPVVIAPFTDETPLAVLRTAAARGLDLAEARVDLFRDQSLKRVVECVRAASAVVPVLATLRSSEEGGKWTGDDGARLALYRELLPHVGAIDVEVDAPVRAAVVQAARRRRSTVVLSYHDFARTPDDSELDRVVARSRAAGADVTKIATLARTEADVARLAALFVRHENQPLVVIGMGEVGKKTRVFLPGLGSLFTFAALEQSTAPGQLGLAETIRELCDYYPSYAARLSQSRKDERINLPRKPARAAAATEKRAVKAGPPAEKRTKPAAPPRMKG